MRLYLIAIVIALIGLWISSEVQAGELCGLRTSGVFDVADWTAQRTKGAVDLSVSLRSRDKKAIKGVGGRIEFFAKDERPLLNFEIFIAKPVDSFGAAIVRSAERRDANAEQLLAAVKGDVIVLACVDHVSYVDGSGMIVN